MFWQTAAGGSMSWMICNLSLKFYKLSPKGLIFYGEALYDRGKDDIIINIGFILFNGYNKTRS